MLRILLSVASAAGVAMAPLGVGAVDKSVLKSVSVDLPAGDSMFPDGPGADVANNNCLACHSADMVLNQPAMSKVQWESEVNKMRTAYKAPIDPNDVDTILDYLARIKGAN
jgi:cytochrome c5